MSVRLLFAVGFTTLLIVCMVAGWAVPRAKRGPTVAGQLSPDQVVIVAHLYQQIARKDTLEILAWGAEESPIGAELFSAPTAHPEKMRWNVIGREVFADAPPTLARRVRFGAMASDGKLVEQELMYLLRAGEIVIAAPVESYRPLSHVGP